jgi:hypothetical protein
MTFFFNVTDTGESPNICYQPRHFFFAERIMPAGSWLEIGQSISFFCITSLLLVWSAGICYAGEVLMADTLKASDRLKRE